MRRGAASRRRFDRAGPRRDRTRSRRVAILILAPRPTPHPEEPAEAEAKAGVSKDEGPRRAASALTCRTGRPLLRDALASRVLLRMRAEQTHALHECSLG